MEPKLKGQIAIVTGSSSGIGAAVAESLGRAGARVLVNYHSDEAGARAVQKKIRATGSDALVVGADVSKEEDVERMFRQVMSTWGRVDIVVCNAGMQQDAPFTEMTLDQWNQVIGVNLTGAFLCAREAARHFCDRGNDEISRAAGKIIFMSSVHQFIPWAFHANYAASKGGMMLLMQSMAQELAPQKIRVNSIAPGAIATSINKEAWSDPEKKEELLKLIPYDRIGTPKDIGQAAVWLASDDSDYVTGTTLVVDGGMALYPAFRGNG